MDFQSIVYIALLTLLPGLELRLSIPAGIALGLSWPVVFAVAVIVNAFLGVAVYFALDTILPFVLRIKFFDSLYKRIVIRTQKKAAPYVDRYGLLGIALFVAIPLPGSGSWTGALAAFLLGLGYRRFAIANLVGVLIAAILVTAITFGVFNLMPLL